MISNPLVINQLEMSILFSKEDNNKITTQIKKNILNNNSNIDDVFKNYKYIYILACNDNVEIDERIYSYTINKELYNNICKNLILIEAPKIIINNFSHFNKISILSKETLERFNINNYEIQDKNLTLLMLNISPKNIKLYLSQYEKSNSLIDVYKLISCNNYFDIKLNSNILLNPLIKYIMNINENNYWTYEKNCKHNLSSNFEKRRLNYIFNRKNKFLDYLNKDYEINTYFDSINIKYVFNNNDIFTKDQINSLIVSLPEKEKFFLFCNLLISKEYSHLAINNYNLLILMKPIINEYIQLFRYLFGYAWARFYIEESIKKSQIKYDDQFIFDINTASELPLFPFSMTCPKLNPYCQIFVDDNILNSEYNIGGLFEYKKKSLIDFTNNKYKSFINNGIASLKEFKKNLNIFLTGCPNKDILKNIDWKKNKIALGGSTICACIQKYHPLVDIFLNYPEDERLKRYFYEYYGNSDIDIMFLTDDVLDFMNKVREFYDQIIVNVCEINNYAELDHFKLICEKYIYLFVTEDDINNIINLNPLLNDLTYDKIINNFESDEIKNIFNPLLDEHLEKYKNNFLSKLSNEELELYQNHYKDYINFDNFHFKIRLSKKKNNVEYMENINDTQIGITYKYKIQSQHLDYPFELFMIKNDYFAVVHSFHLPCVRAYYDGDNVYLTPSCISSHMTLMNLDYKYFAGSSNPIEIINKYRMRGFGTWVNEVEKTKIIKYSYENKFWNNLYEINMVNNKSIYLNLGQLEITHKLFHPRLYNLDDFDNSSINIQLGYNKKDLINNEKIISNNEYLQELDDRYNISSNNTINLILNKLQTINEDGSINPLQKWVIETIWNIKNQKSNFIKKKNKPLKYDIFTF